MQVCAEKTVKTDVAPTENLQNVSQAYAVNEKMVDELVARCDYYLALYVQQLAINEKLSKAQQETTETTGAGKTAAEQAAVEKATGSQINPELEKVLNELIAGNDNFAAILAEKDKLIAHQQVQIMQLGAQNKKYQQLADRIMSRWYGRLLMRAYRFCCRIGIFKEF